MRRLLPASVWLTVLSWSSCTAPGLQGQMPPLQATNPIVVENAKPGDPNWWGGEFAQGREIEGYASAPSVEPGDSLAVHVSVQPKAGAVTWDVYRLGYYGGVGARKLASGGPVTVQPRAVPPPDPNTGRIECAWPTTFSVAIGEDWVSGLYVVRLTAPSGRKALVPFVVIEAEPTARGLVLVPTNTTQAYNDWGGTSLYDSFAPGYTNFRAFEVSYLRPYDQDNITFDLTGRDRYFAYFVESQGYDVAYISDVDLDRHPSLAIGRALVVIEGHSEYWSQRMRDAVEEAVADGESLASFAGNEIYWQVRLEPARDGSDRRTIVCYKDDAAARDPLYRSMPELATVQWRAEPVSRPENALLGNLFDDSTAVGYAPLVVGRPDHWAFAGSGLANGAVIPSLLGYEVDLRMGNGAAPNGLTRLGGSRMLSLYGGTTAAEVTIYEPTPSNFVFGGGSVDWAHGLARRDLWDARVQRIVANVFARGLGLTPAVPKPLVLPSGAPPPVYAPAQVTTLYRGSPLVTPVAVASLGGAFYVADMDAGTIVQVKSGVAKVIASGLELPSGVAAGSDGKLYVSTAGSNEIVRVTTAGKVSAFVGSGDDGKSDGNGSHASFAMPRGLCAGADGALYVADVGNRAIRRVTLAGDVSTFSDDDLHLPWTVGCAADGSLVVPDAKADELLEIDRSGNVSVLAGQGDRGVLDGSLDRALLGGGAGVVVAADRVVFAEAASASVREVRQGQVKTLAGGVTALPQDGTGAAAGIGLPAGIVQVDARTFVVVDTANAALLRLVVTD